MFKLQNLLKTSQYAGGIFCRCQGTVSASQKLKETHTNGEKINEFLTPKD